MLPSQREPLHTRIGRRLLLSLLVAAVLAGCSSLPEEATPDDFSLSVTPKTQTVIAGGDASYDVTVSAMNGFTGKVSLAVFRLPSGASGAFGPATVTGSGTSTLAINTTTATPPGNYFLVIAGKDKFGFDADRLVTLKVVASDFSLSAAPPSQTVIAGGDTSYDVTVGALNGFNGAVNLAVSGLPGGASGAFGPTSVTGSGTSTLAINTTAATPPGTYPLTITGTSGQLIHSANVTLVVTKTQADFTISAAPPSQSIPAGGFTSYDVTVGALNGFNGTVGLAVTGLPAGATAGFSPMSVTGSGASTLTVVTLCSTPPGTYPLTITGMSGQLTHSTDVTLIVVATNCTSGLFVSHVDAPAAAAGSGSPANINAIGVFGNNGATGFNGVTVAFTGLPAAPAITPVALNLIGVPGNCVRATLTCTLTGTLAPGSVAEVVLTFQGVPGTPSFTGTATVSAPGATSASASFTTAILNCAPGPTSLCGQYVLFVQGYTSAGAKTIAASFATDGAGHVTQGTLDYNSIFFTQASLAILTGSPTGYTFDADGLGNLTLNTSAGPFVFKFAIDPNVGTVGSVIEFEPAGAPIPGGSTSSGSGFLQLQAPDFNVAQIIGNYGFAAIGGLGGASNGVRAGMLGAVTADGACGFGATGATGTINSGGTLSRGTTFSGTLAVPGCFMGASNGRGQGTFSSITGTPAPSFSSVHFAYYILDTNADGTVNHMVMVSTDPPSATQPILSGIIARQHNSPYNTNAALDCGLVAGNLGCVFGFTGATGGNSLFGNSYVLAGLASITTQSNTAGAFSLLRDENNGGTVTSGTLTATYSYNADGTGSFTPSTGEAIDFVLTDIDTGLVLSEGGKVASGLFGPEFPPSGPFNPAGAASATFYAGTLFAGTASATNTAGLATVTQAPAGTNTGTFTGNTGFWNTATNQNTGALSGSYTADTVTTRVSGTTNILGAASFSAYQLGTNQFVLVGTASGDTAGVLMVFH